ncbi:MAG: ATP-dependent DNA ligase [Anaerolineae bacterium]|nr:ATP-dependent DNA ligase [Anaerolineae bacterium]
MQDFVHTSEAVAATRSRLEKAAQLQTLFSRLSDADLARAARYLSGRAFPLSDQRVLNVGYANVRDALLTLVPTPDEAYSHLVVRLADMGDVAYELLGRRPDPPPTLTLADLADLFDQLAAASGAKARGKLLTATLARATALEAKYIVKIVMGELRIGLQEGQVEDAIARAYGVRVEAVQWANMLLGDLGETAVLARQGRLGEAHMRLFHPIKFMLASPAASPDDVAKQMPSGFLVEDKFDGVRAQVHKQGGRLAIFSRTLDEVAHRYPELHAPLLALPGEFILDGEILGWRDGRAIPFTEFQARLGRKTVDAELLASLPVAFMAFDLLYQDGDVLLEQPLRERRRCLETLLAVFPHPYSLILSQAAEFQAATALPAAFDAARERGNEGLMVKEPGSTYKPGRRGKEWLKVKRPLATLDVVVTGVEWGNGKRRHVLSDYTFAVQDDEGQLLEVGKAYSGLTDAEIAELTAWFQAHTIEDYGKFRRVEPLIVLEVAFDNVQPSDRHPSGYALRFPRIVRVGTDKLPADIDTLDTVRALAGVR